MQSFFLFIDPVKRRIGEGSIEFLIEEKIGGIFNKELYIIVILLRPFYHLRRSIDPGNYCSGIMYDVCQLPGSAANIQNFFTYLRIEPFDDILPKLVNKVVLQVIQFSIPIY